MQKKLFSFFVIPVCAALLISFSISHISMQLGDNLLAHDKFSIAKKLFIVSHVTNPFHIDIEKRILAASVLLTEHTQESEETNDPKMLTELPKGSFVLGTSTQIPVLMYHYIRINPDTHDKVGFNLSVTPANFSTQLDWLAEHGYHTITLDDLGANLLYHSYLPPKPIVLTFDDGYRDFYTSAFPILKAHNMHGVNFVITGFVDLPRYLTWSQIIEMKNSGFVTFGSHTIHHPALTYLSPDAVLQEMVQSKHDLEIHLGYPINWLAYPYGDVNEQVANSAKKAGYVGAFGTQFGTFESTDLLFTEPRVRVGGGDNAQSLGARLPWN